MSECNFYSPDEVKPLYDEIVLMYQAAFAGKPWNEVSKCIDLSKRCVGGFTSLKVGQTCETCQDCPTQTAYEYVELVERFDILADTRPTEWYIEQENTSLTLAAIAWRAYPPQIIEERYKDVPEMSDWLSAKLAPEISIVWLDEVFANKNIKPKGNLKNFGKFVVGLADILKVDFVAYRTIEPRMTAVATRDFKENVQIFKGNVDLPDRRDFVMIKAEKRT